MILREKNKCFVKQVNIVALDLSIGLNVSTSNHNANSLKIDTEYAKNNRILLSINYREHENNSPKQTRY